MSVSLINTECASKINEAIEASSIGDLMDAIIQRAFPTPTPETSVNGNDPHRPKDMCEIVGWVYDYWVSKRRHGCPPVTDCIDLSEIGRLKPSALALLSIVHIEQRNTDFGLFGEPSASFLEVCKSGHLWHRRGWAEPVCNGETAFQETLALPVLGDDQTIDRVVMVTVDLPATMSSTDEMGCFTRWLSPASPFNA